MELIDTRVLHEAGTDRVEFWGEGGESVRVTLASGDTKRTDDEIIKAAKVVLVQIATFGMTDEEANARAQHVPAFAVARQN
ncbi:hypothetical protein [Mesorhizobium sp. dw_380]|uniref:hypothetical protein n=1 Tax=Mesorhizobium sp. dw_380 TaxID=2812001 RepID=UPI001BDEA475|nr:hypothetical protein [Mesorhizobium sp. dw_380]